MRLDIKPLSVNRAWKGRRFKTDEYKRYERDVLMLLEPMTIPDGWLELRLKFGFSRKTCDFDNPVKLFVDCLQKKYGFNDKMIRLAIIQVDHVEIGKEYIEFEIYPIEIE